eukprot:gene3525-2391_t
MLPCWAAPCCRAGSLRAAVLGRSHAAAYGPAMAEAAALGAGGAPPPHNGAQQI